MLRTFLITLLGLTAGYCVEAQIVLNGRLLDAAAQPVAGAIVQTSLPDQSTTDTDGSFRVQHVNSSQILITFIYNGQTFSHTRTVDGSADIELGVITFDPAANLGDDFEVPTLSLEEVDEADLGNVSGLLQSRDDIFSIMTAFNFSPARYRRRGLEAEYTDGYLNYFPVNDLESGGVFWSNWGGLNDVTRLTAEVVGADLADWGNGGISGTFNIDLRASAQRHRTRVSYASTNRNYRNRLMATWSTGLRPSGWAVTASVSRRWAEEGFIEGTYYDANAYFLSVDKHAGKHNFNFTVLGSPYERGGNSISIQEMYDLAGSNYYNSYWGYQQGEKRSGRIYSGHQPYALFRHDWKWNDRTSLTTALGYQFGISSVEAIDWWNANDPRPDYYRRLPSYVDNPVLAEQLRQNFIDNPELLQVQWDHLYSVNLNSIFTVNNVDGVEGNDLTGKLSRYIMEERRADLSKGAANLILQHLIGENAKLQGGVQAVVQNTRNYKVVSDLLGGEFYVDFDKFAEQDFPGDFNALQNDLRRPNRIVREGEQFGYDYTSKIRQYGAWASYSVNARKYEVGVSAAYETQTYWREGHTQNGRFPDSSFGKGEEHSFSLPSVKGLLRYKFDGRNYITASGMMANYAPTFRNAYFSPRTRDAAVTDLTEEKTMLGEIRYDYRAPYLRVMASGFYLTAKDGIETTSFYHDDENTFVNFSLRGIDRRFQGIELATEYKLSPRVTLQGAASIGEYIYTSRPTATITQDNNGQILQQNVTVYAKNLYVAGTPQSAYTAGFVYNSRQFWRLFVNINRFEENRINFNPLRRTIEAVDPLEAGSDLWNQILTQEKTDPVWTLDISFNKTILLRSLPGNPLLGFNFSITNVLNEEDYISGGYEQYRFDYDTKDVNAFPSRYAYMQGLNYFLQAYLSF